MKKLMSIVTAVVLLVTSVVPLTATALTGEQDDFRYAIVGSQAVILSYNGDASHVVIPSYIDGNPVVAINDHAFSHNTTMQTVTIPDSVVSIGDAAFFLCTALKEITLPDSVTSLGEWAFYYCTSLTDVTLSNGLTEIGDQTFADCTALTEIVIPDNVHTISGAFYSCTALANITLPDTLIYVGETTFYNTAYVNNSENWDGDVLYIGQVLYEAKTTLNGSCTVKDGTVLIANAAFQNCTALETVTLPQSVKVLNTSAFSGCTSLTSATLPAQLEQIPAGLFNGCSALEEVSIPDSVISVGRLAYNDTAYDHNAENWEDGVLYLDGHLIKADESLKGAYTVKADIKSIAGGAFENCSLLETVAIPSGIDVIEYNTFYNCTSLQSVTLPDTLTAIGSRAFYNCKALCDITLPASLESIGDDAFSECDALKEITLPASVLHIGEKAFDRCDALTAIYVDEDNDVYEDIDGVLFRRADLYDCVFGMYGRTLIRYPVGRTDKSYFVPNDTVMIGDRAFANNNHLKHVMLSSGVSVIGKEAFQSCEELESADIPVDVDRIDDCAFCFCYSLNTVYYLSGTKMDWNAIWIGIDTYYLDDVTLVVGGYGLGDVNGDGTHSMMDVMAIYLATAGIETLADDQKEAADMDQDGYVSVMDALALYKRVAGNA